MRDTMIFGPSFVGGEPLNPTGAVAALPPEAEVCGCNGICKSTIIDAIAGKGLTSVDEVRTPTKASASCGSCTGVVEQLLVLTLGDAFQADAVQPLCACTELGHDDVRRLIIAEEIKSIPQLMQELEWSTSCGCANCRPSLDSYLIAAWPGEYKDDNQSRFINERVHANIQKDGTYSVVPRMWGGMTTPDELRAIADVADNPGGGGRGHTTWLLESLVAAGAQGAILGVMNDPTLAADAHEKGVGAIFEAKFNRDEPSNYSNKFSYKSEVLNLSDGKFIGADPGTFANLQLDLGPTAVLQVGTVTVVVVSIREQCIDPNFFESFGVKVSEARSVTVKSRGHFRAGFLPYFPAEQVLECDAPGLTSPNLASFEWTGFPRPVFPLDPVTNWTPPDW